MGCDLVALGDSVRSDHSADDTVSHTSAILSRGRIVTVPGRSKAVRIPGVGGRLEEAIRLKGTSISQLERDSGVSRTTLHRITREDVISPSVTAKVAGALKIPESALLNGGAPAPVQEQDAYRAGLKDARLEAARRLREMADALEAEGPQAQSGNGRVAPTARTLTEAEMRDHDRGEVVAKSARNKQAKRGKGRDRKASGE